LNAEKSSSKFRRVETACSAGVSNKGQKHYVWVDTKLHCVVKTDEGGGIELRNIQEGPQPASLFEVPAGYTNFDMGGMRPRP
jgi:hypothetical protein